VVPVAANHIIIRSKCSKGANRNGFFSDIEMQESGNLRESIHFRRFFFEPADQEHVPIQREQVGPIHISIMQRVENRLNPYVVRSEQNLDVGAIDLHFIAIHFCGGIVHTSTGGHIVLPPMPGTSDDVSSEVAFTKGSTSVDTGVVNHIESPVHVKDRESLAVHFRDDAVARIDICSGSHSYEL